MPRLFVKAATGKLRLGGTVVLRSETFDLNPALTDKWQETSIEGATVGVYACIVSPIVKEVKHILTVVGSNGKPILDKSMQNND